VTAGPFTVAFTIVMGRIKHIIFVFSFNPRFFFFFFFCNHHFYTGNYAYMVITHHR
jgi:hypothetical protein